MCLFFGKTLVSGKILIFSSNFLFWRPNTIETCVSRNVQATQGRSESTSSVAFELQIINYQRYFINLFIFNCLKLNIKLFIFKLFDVKFLFSENRLSQTEENGCLWTYGCASLVRISNSPRKIWPAIFETLINFWSTAPCEYTKIRTPNKRYRTNMVRTFWGTPSTSALSLDLGLNHLGSFGTKISEIKVRRWNKKF